MIDGDRLTDAAIAVRTFLQELQGVTQVHDLHIWAMSTTETALTSHLVIAKGYTGDRFLTDTCEALHTNFGIDHSTLQIESGDRDYPCHLEPDSHV